MTANPIKGEVAFEADGQAYILVMDFNALCILEDSLDLGVQEIVARLETQVRGGFLRSLVWAGLQEHQPGITEKAAGQIVGAYGFDKTVALVIEGFAKAFPKREAATGALDPQPPPAKRGRGKSNASTPPGAVN
jgi:hypothetical protein